MYRSQMALGALTDFNTSWSSCELLPACACVPPPALHTSILFPHMPEKPTTLYRPTVQIQISSVGSKV